MLVKITDADKVPITIRISNRKYRLGSPSNGSGEGNFREDVREIVSKGDTTIDLPPLVAEAVINAGAGEPAPAHAKQYYQNIVNTESARLSNILNSAFDNYSKRMRNAVDDEGKPVEAMSRDDFTEEYEKLMSEESSSMYVTCKERIRDARSKLEAIEKAENKAKDKAKESKKSSGKKKSKK